MFAAKQPWMAPFPCAFPCVSLFAAKQPWMN